MTIYASVHGRAGNDPVRSTTASGKAMTRVSIAVNAAGFNAETEETVWISVLAFGRAAEDLARTAKSQMVTAQGKLTRGRFTGKDGQERESWSLIADAILVAASSRPPGKPRSQGEPPQGQRPPRARAPAAAGAGELPFDDEIAF